MRDAQSPPNPWPDLPALHALECVQDMGSVRHAAQHLGVSDSAVSQSIRGLEASLNAVLLDRSRRPAQLTAHGRLLLEQAKPLLSYARQFAVRASRLTAEGHNSIRLGCVDSFAATVGPELVRGLSGRVRDFHMFSGITPHIADQLQSRAIDFAICTDDLAADARVTSQLLFSEAWVAVFPRGVDLGRIGRFSTLLSLTQGLPLIRYSGRSTIGLQIERFLNHVGVQAPRRFEFDATDPLLGLVAAGLGWAVTSPLCLLQSQHYAKEVQAASLPRSELGQRHFYLLSIDESWGELQSQLAHMTQDVIRRSVAPTVARLFPHLHADAFRIR